MTGLTKKHNYYWSIRGKAASSRLDYSLRTFELTELVAAIKSCADWSLFFRQRIEYPSLGYDLDANGNSNRILLACGMSEWRSDDAQEWMAVSRSKSDRLYHIERIDAWDSYEGPEFEVTESSATKTYPSDLIDQIAADHNGFGETDGVPPFINARSRRPTRAFARSLPPKAEDPGENAWHCGIEDELAKLEKKAEPKKTPKPQQAAGLFHLLNQTHEEGPMRALLLVLSRRDAVVVGSLHPHVYAGVACRRDLVIWESESCEASHATARKPAQVPSSMRAYTLPMGLASVTDSPR